MSSNSKGNYINGAWQPSRSGESIEIRNPSNGELLGEIPESSADELNEALSAAETAQPAWAKLPAIQRAAVLRELSTGIRDNATEIARTLVEEGGKVLPLAEVEVQFTADYIDYMAEWARRIEGEIIPSDRPDENIFFFRKPIGVVGGILPWNFPFFLIARKLAPALITGNTIVIKPSEETPLNAQLFFDVVEKSGLPGGVANLVCGWGRTIGSQLSSSDKIGLISFTGSVETGSRIMTAAAPNITKLNLELGGKAPAIVLADADIDLAAKAVHASRVINSGQVCNCAERIYVESAVADEFTAKLVDLMKNSKTGDPFAEGIDYGPMINKAGFEKVHELVGGAVKDGAEVLTGGASAEVKGGEGGHYYQPTVLGNCRQDMDIISNEIFGPVIPVVQVADLDEAIAAANDSDYGLTSSIYTSNLSKSMRAVNELKFGETYINRENFEAIQGFHAGWRKSGVGGADGKHGLLDYTHSHIVYLNYASKP